MFSFLSGTIHSTHDRNITLLVNNIGYLVNVTREMLEKSRAGDPIELFIYTNVREDELSLYGFPTEDQWRFFKQLLTVSGVGPRSAMEILNAPLSQVKRAIAQKDSAWLTRTPGIGRKTAERIIVDLSAKIKDELLVEDTTQPLESREEIIQALINMGYQRQRVVAGLKQIPQEITGEEAVIKYFLQHC